ncbi:hypothetical protein BH09BAC6_BH09BAC6_04470 [soil metagenome]|jgi:hypothetical protein
MRLKSLFIALFVIVLFAGKNACAQDTAGATVFHIRSSNTSFPDTGRARGHTYNNKFFSTEDHYSDNTVLIVAPKKLDAGKTVDLVFWFHGWNNNVDNSAAYYELTKQFIASKRNAVLVLAETTRDAPDSYGGKLENKGVFRSLVADVVKSLIKQQLIPGKCAPGHILLGGHSGAYRVMARIIANGQMSIDEAMLFDSLYGETDKYMAWIKADGSHRFIHLFTNNGGTFDESHNMVKQLAGAGIKYKEIEESALSPAELNYNAILFIHSLKEHNDVVNQNNFKLMLENEPFLKSIKE